MENWHFAFGGTMSSVVHKGQDIQVRDERVSISLYHKARCAIYQTIMRLADQSSCIQGVFWGKGVKLG
jgi:hypothetical protein